MGSDCADLLVRILEIDKEILDATYISRCADEIEKMLSVVADQMSLAKRPEENIEIINKLMFAQNRFLPVSSKNFQLDMSSRLVSNVVIKKQGYCVELAIIYLIIARKLNLPIIGVAIPLKHFFVRYLLPDRSLNIELSYQGKIMSDEFYFERFKLLSNGSMQTKHLVPLTDDGVIAFYLNVIGQIFFKQKKLETALKYFKRESELAPELPKSHYALGYTYLTMGENGKAIEEFEKEKAINPNFLFLYPYLSKLYLQRGEYKKAMENLEQTIECLRKSELA